MIVARAFDDEADTLTWHNTMRRLTRRDRAEANTADKSMSHAALEPDNPDDGPAEPV